MPQHICPSLHCQCPGPRPSSCAAVSQSSMFMLYSSASYMSTAALYTGGGSAGTLAPAPIPCSRMIASSDSFRWCASSRFWYPAISSWRLDDAVRRDACVSPRARSGATEDADAASLCGSSCVHADGAADTLRETRDEAAFDASWVGVEYDQAVGPVGDVGEAKRRSRGGSCGGVSPSYGFGNRDRPSSVSVLGAALCTASVSRRPGLSAK